MEPVGGGSFLGDVHHLKWNLMAFSPDSFSPLSLSVLCIVDEMWSASFQSLTPLFPCLLSGLLQGDEFCLFRNLRLFSAYSLFSFRIIIYGSKTLVNNSYDLDQVHVTNTIKSSSPKTKQNKKPTKNCIWKMTKGNTFLKENIDV